MVELPVGSGLLNFQIEAHAGVTKQLTATAVDC